MFKDFKELLSVLNDNRVKYLVVGGYAVSFHAQPRATKDLDILVKPDRKNGVALFRALADFGAPLTGFEPGDLVEKGKFFRMGSPPVAVDILPEIDGIDSFDAVWRRRVEVSVDEKTGLKAWFISAEDLVIAKVAAGRAQDIADADAVRKAQSGIGGVASPRLTKARRKKKPRS